MKFHMIVAILYELFSSEKEGGKCLQQEYLITSYGRCDWGESHTWHKEKMLADLAQSYQDLLG